MRRVNRYLHAFKENFNMVGLATVVAVSVAALNPLPLLAGLVAEAVYLLFVPDSQWYDARLARRYDAEVERRRQQLKAQVLPMLPRDMQARFMRLEETRRQIQTQPFENQTWFPEVLRKLDYLLEKFLMFASKEVQFRSYLRSVLEEVHRDQGSYENPPTLPGPKPAVAKKEEPGAESGAAGDRSRRRIPINTPPPLPTPPTPPAKEAVARDLADRWVQQAASEIRAHYERELSRIKSLLEKEQDDNTKAVLEKRLDVLQRRQEFVDKIGKILTNLDHQLALLEDTFGLISDEIRARSPEQILSDIEDVVGQTDTMTQVLEEVAPYEQLAARIEQTRA